VVPPSIRMLSAQQSKFARQSVSRGRVVALLLSCSYLAVISDKHKKSKAQTTAADVAATKRPIISPTSRSPADAGSFIHV